MGTHSRLTDQQMCEIIKLRRASVPWSKISKKYNFSGGSHLRQVIEARFPGLDLSGSVRHRHNRAEPKPPQLAEPLSAATKNRIRELAQQGLSLTAIATVIRKPYRDIIAVVQATGDERRG